MLANWYPLRYAADPALVTPSNNRNHAMRLSWTLVLNYGLISLAVLPAQAADNTPPPGFTALFNGKDLTGWKGLVANPPARARMSPERLAKAKEAADKLMREHWKVEDGVLVYDGKANNLCTAKDYGDFEMFVDWKIGKGGDSGIYLRGSPQVQIWDNKIGSGGLYNNQRQETRTTRLNSPTSQSANGTPFGSRWWARRYGSGSTANWSSTT